MLWVLGGWWSKRDCVGWIFPFYFDFRRFKTLTLNWDSGLSTLVRLKIIYKYLNAKPRLDNKHKHNITRLT